MSQPPEQGAHQGLAQEQPEVADGNLSDPQNVNISLARFSVDMVKLVDNQEKTTKFIETITEGLSQLKANTDAKVSAVKSELEKELVDQKAAMESDIMTANHTLVVVFDKRIEALDAKLDGIKAGLEAELAQQNAILNQAIGQIRHSQDMAASINGRLNHLHMKIDTFIYGQMLPPAVTPTPAPAVPPSPVFAAPAAASMPATPTAPFTRRRGTADAPFAAATPATANPPAPIVATGAAVSPSHAPAPSVPFATRRASSDASVPTAAPTVAMTSTPVHAPAGFAMPATPTTSLTPRAAAAGPSSATPSFHLQQGPAAGSVARSAPAINLSGAPASRNTSASRPQQRPVPGQGPSRHTEDSTAATQSHFNRLLKSQHGSHPASGDDAPVT